ncbi:solute carrier family 6 (neurotransmitter transporter, serotonin) member 4 [Schistosoma bovis]|uniref:Solute carrier family 6 (Neurotransmitter transporter, serotonin) member 4 n=1 Tax=Schistosoma bovis TaxID=6184 RepID=A0A430QAV5_SCHBO|nr:solute carrier family 6 (neurotransmitter transporter, serotonin) member 4 [Schistosoma bovis]
MSLNECAFLIPYLVMYIFGGLPLFYLELALGQYQRSGCLTVWKRICPLFSGIGFGICIIASYTAWYYNTIIAWALFYMIDAMKPHIPWDGCNNWWNTNSCVTVYERLINHSMLNASHKYELNELVNLSIANLKINGSGEVFSSTEEYFYYVNFILFLQAVWVTATMPYVILTILLIRGLTLEGSLTGIKYYLTPNFSSLLSTSVWSDAASQIFFSLGPGFGVLLALSSYNKFHNNCYRDAMITSFINCATSFVSGFVVFSVLGYMCFRMGKTMEDVANEGPGLVFIAYPEAIATLAGSTFWAIIFMLMLITLGLDSTFGGLEAIITAVMDSVPALSGRRELFVLAVVVYCFIGALASTTCGIFIANIVSYETQPVSVLGVVYEPTTWVIALSWAIVFSSPIFIPILMIYQLLKAKGTFLEGIFIANIVSYETQPVSVLGVVYEPTTWVIALSWAIVFSSPIFIPILMIYQLLKAKGTFLERLRFLTTPEDRPAYGDQQITLNAIGEYVPKKTSKTNKLYGNPQ